DVDGGTEFEELSQRLTQAHLRPGPPRLEREEAVRAVVQDRDVRDPGGDEPEAGARAEEFCCEDRLEEVWHLAGTRPGVDNAAPRGRHGSTSRRSSVTAAWAGSWATATTFG